MTMLSPNAMVYVVFEKNKREIYPIVFYPFAPQITLEMRDLNIWVREIISSRVAGYIIILTMIWAVLAFLQIFLQ